jgi:PTH1 family peptidyl-tRNA hydrolase
MKPQTYMNLSGTPVRQAMSFYKTPLSNVIAVSDDVSMPAGKLRIRRRGSSGGHKGLQDILLKCGSDDFPRIKIGVGEKPHPDIKLETWVLSNFTKDEQKVMFDIFGCVYDCADMFLRGFAIDKIQNKYN